MSKYNFPTDTIAAISTATGPGGIGIIRLSGADALAITDKIFVSEDQAAASQFKTHTVHHGQVLSDDKSILDDVLVTVMRAPKSYTREDVVEISCHGGTVALRAILSLAVKNGARLAEPGEFTKRAFLNGRIDLIQAEAVLDIIQAKTESFLKVSASQLKGELTKQLEAIREQLLYLYAEAEAVVNFPEEDVDAFDQKKFSLVLDEIRQRVTDLLATSDEGRILKEGIRVVICGRPNVGKSSLLNVLLRQPRAIVSPIEGTTRDTIEETVQIHGVPLQLVDTAGILTPRDQIEEEAVKRSRIFIENADLVLFLLDISQPISAEDRQIFQLISKKNFLVVGNKCDLENRISDGDLQAFLPGRKILPVSAVQKIGIDSLQEAIIGQVLHGKAIDSHRVMVTNLRHVECLRAAQAAVERGQECLKQKMSPEFVSEEIKMAVNALDKITGRDADHDLLERIFSEFCIGK